MARSLVLASCAFAACLAWVGTCSGAREGATRAALDVRLVRGADATAAPVSLTASDGTGLELRELTAKVVLEPPLAFTQIELAFRNPEPRRLEGRFEITLPEAASISRLALQIGDRFQEGEIVERRRAQVAYEEALHGRRDPALLERDAGNQYGVRVFPIEAHETKRVIVAYSQLIAGDEAAYRLHLAGLPLIDRVRFEVSRPQAQAQAQTKPRVFERRAWRPNGDLEVSLPESSGTTALVHGDMALVQVRPATQSNPTALERLTVLFDTSASRVGGFETQIERMQAIVKELAEQRGSPIPVQLVVFDQEVVPLLEARSDQLGPDLTAQLLERGALGATDLEAALQVLAMLDGIGDHVLIFTDGVASAGASDEGSIARVVDELGARGVKRLDVVTHGTLLDRAILDALVHAELPEAGVVVSDASAVAAAQRLLRGTERRVELEIEGAEWTFPSVLAGVEPGRAYPIFVKLGSAAALQLRLGGERVPVTTAKASMEALLDHEWARARIAHLQARTTALPDADAQRARAQIVELSQKHRVLSDHTALVVLENESDYLRNGIARTALSDVTVVQDGALAAAQEPQAAPDPMSDDFGGRGERRMARGGGVAVGPGDIGTIGGALGASTSGILGVLAGPGPEGASWGNGLGSPGSNRSGGDAPVTRVHGGKLDVRGELSKEVIRRVVQRHLNEARFCYEQGLSRRPELEGEAVVRFVISPTGAVSQAALASSTLPDARVEQCLTHAVQRWVFPSPEGGGIAVVTYPFAFSSDRTQTPSARSSIRLQRPLYDMMQLEREPRAKKPSAAKLRRERASEWERRAQPRPVQYLQGPMLDTMELLEMGDAQEAFLRARAWQRKSPQDVIALLALARTAQSVGEQTLAARAYGSLIDLFPSRPDMRRAAGEGLEDLGDAALGLAIDSYRKAVELRPDHPSSHRLLGMALWRSGKVEQGRAALVRANTGLYPSARFPGVPQLLARDAELAQTTLWAPHQQTPEELLRVCVYWETDATDLDLHVYDGAHRHAGDLRLLLDNGASLGGDVATGYGPECFTATGSEIAYPYLLQAQYASRGAMGYALGALHVLRIDARGEASFESRPFVVMRDGAFLPLGELEASPVSSHAPTSARTLAKKPAY